MCRAASRVGCRDREEMVAVREGMRACGGGRSGAGCVRREA